MAKQDKTPQANIISKEPFPASKKIYVQGHIYNDVQVAMRTIEQTDTKTFQGKIEKNPPITVYDTSGPYTDINIEIDIKKGLPRLREKWILQRGDIERLFELSSEYGTKRMQNKTLDTLRFEHIKMPLKAKESRNITQMHYARKGIITPEMEYIAIRENQRLEAYKSSLNGQVEMLCQQHVGETPLYTNPFPKNIL